MSLHQIIYTSCKRGIKGNTAGQQVYSQDIRFPLDFLSEVKKSFSYKSPYLTEDSQNKPESFQYFFSSRRYLALNTYLPYDYNGNSVETDNFLSHAIVLDSENLPSYPCEFYGGGSLLSAIDSSLIKSPYKPSPLPSPTLAIGEIVNKSTVLQFLSHGIRLQVFKSMLSAVISYEKDKKQLVICDSRQNIIFWIAALQYAFPLKNALKITFNTYEFDPKISEFQIIGVAQKGTLYKSIDLNSYYVFDFFQEKFHQPVLDEGIFFLIDTIITDSMGKLLCFHEFLSAYSYEKVNAEIYVAFTLYTLVSQGFAQISIEHLLKSLIFVGYYATDEEKNRIAVVFLEYYGEISRLDRQRFFHTLSYLLAMKNNLPEKQKKQVEQLPAERILYDILEVDTGNDEFLQFYERISDQCKKYNIHLDSDLFLERKEGNLFGLIKKNEISRWKISFLIEKLILYFNQSQEKTEKYRSVPSFCQLFIPISRTMYHRNHDLGLFTMSCILKCVSADFLFLMEVALHLEAILQEKEGNTQELELFWADFREYIDETKKDKILSAYEYFGMFKRKDLIFLTIGMEIRIYTNLNEVNIAFRRHLRDYISKDSTYSKKYATEICGIYYNKLNEFSKESSHKAKIELLHTLSTRKICLTKCSELVGDIMVFLPFSSSNPQDSVLIQQSFVYIHTVCGKNPTGKLSLLLIAVMLEKIQSHEEGVSILGDMKKMTEINSAPVSGLSEKSLDAYLERILPPISKNYLKSDELIQVFRLFKMDSAEKNLFFLKTNLYYVQQFKVNRNTKYFAEYFDALLESNQSEAVENMATALERLANSKIQILNSAMRRHYQKKSMKLESWEKVMDSTVSKKSFHSLTDFFKIKNRKLLY